MRFPALYRVLLAVWGLWFSAALIEPSLTHDCAMATAPAMAPSHDHGGHASHGSAPTHRHDSAPGERCSHCLDHCCAAPVAVLGARQSLKEAPTVIVELLTTWTRPYFHSRAEHALPFSNGPPRIASAIA